MRSHFFIILLLYHIFRYIRTKFQQKCSKNKAFTDAPAIFTDDISFQSNTHYRCQGALHEAEYMLRVLRQKKEADETLEPPQTEATEGAAAADPEIKEM